MTWRVPGKGLRFAAVIDRLHEGQVHAVGWLGEDQDLCEVIRRADGIDRSLRLVTEANALGLLFPHASNHPTTLASGGLPPLEEHAALARQAVAAADITPAMRRAFTACLDNGAPHDVNLAKLRERTFARQWPALELAARHPVLARSLLEMDRTLLEGHDPMGKIRERWPMMTDAHLRRLGESGGKRGLALDPTTKFEVANTLSLLLSIPVDWWPEKRDWRTFEACAAAIGAISRSSIMPIAHKTLSSSAGGDWPAFAARLSRACGLTDAAVSGRKLAERGKDCGDPVRAFAREVMVPLFAFNEDDDGRMRMEYAYGQRLPDDTPNSDRDPSILAAERGAQSILYQGKSAPGVLELSGKWHARQDAMQAEIRGKDGGAQWPPLFEGEHRDGDVGIVAVRDYEALREEGRAGPDREGVWGLDHCVASRLPECLSGRAHVLSVRSHAPDGTWERLSTCQVSVDRVSEGRFRLSVFEHRGEGNDDPPAAAEAARARLSDAVLAGRVPLLPEAVAYREPANGGSIARKCGYDWRDEGELARALLTWEPLLPRWARGMTPFALYDALKELGFVPPREEADETAPGMR